MTSHANVCFLNHGTLPKPSPKYRAMVFSPSMVRRHVPTAVDELYFCPFVLPAAFSELFTNTHMNIFHSLHPSKDPTVFLSSCSVSGEVKFPFKAELLAALEPLLLQLSAPGQHLRQPDQGAASSAASRME